MKIYALNGEKKTPYHRGYWEYYRGYEGWYSSLTRLYKFLPQSIKNDFYENKFDGDLSKFYLIGPYIKSGLLVKKMDIPGKENEKTKYCFIYGLAMTKQDFDSMKKALEYFLYEIMWCRVRKHFRLHLFSYVTVKADNMEQEKLFQELGFVKLSFEGLYYLSLKNKDCKVTPYLFRD